MIDYTAILKANPNGVLATQDGSKVKTRVFQYLFSDGNKVYFCTSKEKPVYSQLQASPTRLSAPILKTLHPYYH